MVPGEVRRSIPPTVRRVLPRLLAGFSFPAVLAFAVRLLAWRKDQGDESSASIRRLKALAGVQLRPTNSSLTRVRIDLVLAGGVLDLTAVPRVPGGIDVTVRAVMGGMAVQVPPGWRVWWRFRGIGGVGADDPVVRAQDEAGADLRLHVRCLFGGIGIESAG